MEAVHATERRVVWRRIDQVDEVAGETRDQVRHGPEAAACVVDQGDGLPAIKGKVCEFHGQPIVG